MNDKTHQPDAAAAAGAAVYSKPLLSGYDLWVLGFSNTFVWRCPTRLLLEFYNEHISGNHLDVGVGTGYSWINAPFQQWQSSQAHKVGGVREKKKKTTYIFELIPLRSWQSPPPFIAKKEEGAGQGNKAAKNDDFQYRIIAANPFNRDILEG